MIGVTLRATFFQRRAGLVTSRPRPRPGKQGYDVTDVGAAEGTALADALLPDLLRQFA